MEEINEERINKMKIMQNSDDKMDIDDLVEKMEISKKMNIMDIDTMEIKQENKENKEKFKIDFNLSLEDCINLLKKRINNKNSLDYQVLNRRKAKLDIMINSDDPYFSEIEIKARDVNI